MANKKKLGFSCTLCGTNLKVPFCCEELMDISDKGVLICKMCNTDQKFPICCGKKVKIIIDP